MVMPPTCLIIRAAGTNCDRELAHAFTLAGACCELVHLNPLINRPDLIAQADLIGFPGGFSFGDDIAAGRIMANRLRHRLLEPLRAAIDRGVPIIGICNGFQVLVKAGLLPDPDMGRQAATLADNATGRFVDKWVGVTVPSDTVCIWTRGIKTIELPIAHGEGRFVPESADLLQRWRHAGQIAFEYADGDNPNGSVDGVAGVCDPSGLVLGLMPHPERYTHVTNHPRWQRHRGGDERVVGLKLFENAVEYVHSRSSKPAPAGSGSAPDALGAPGA